MSPAALNGRCEGMTELVRFQGCRLGLQLIGSHVLPTFSASFAEVAGTSRLGHHFRIPSTTAFTVVQAQQHRYS